MPKNLTKTASNTVPTVVPADPAASLPADPLPAPGSDLTPGQRKFAEGLLKGLSKTDGYLAAYPNTRKRRTACAEGGKLSRDPRIQQFMQALASRVTDLSAVGVADVERAIVRVAFSDITKLFGPDGQILPVGQWSDDAAASVASYEETVSGDGTLRKRKIKMWDKPGALKLLADMKGLTNAKPDTTQRATFTFNFGAARPGMRGKAGGRVIDQDAPAPTGAVLEASG